MTPIVSRQSEFVTEKNAAFFKDNIANYSDCVAVLDTYRNIRHLANEALRGIDRLLDIGNGGTFDYDVAAVPEIVAVDLFLEGLSTWAFPANVTPRNGSALAVPERDGSFDGVFMSMLIHHLIGKSVEESIANVSRAVDEAFRVLKPGGRLVVVESCVPDWFYAFERVVFPLANKIIGFFMEHPATLQYPPSTILELLKARSTDVRAEPIPKGRWILQYGLRYPTALTPAAPYIFIARK